MSDLIGYDRAKFGVTKTGVQVRAGLIENGDAVSDAAFSGLDPTWEVTSTTYSGFLPLVETYTNALDANQVIRLTNTWGTPGGVGSRLLSTLYERSYDAGSTWPNFNTLTNTYDAGGKFVSDGWS